MHGCQGVSGCVSMGKLCFPPGAYVEIEECASGGPSILRITGLNGLEVSLSPQFIELKNKMFLCIRN